MNKDTYPYIWKDKYDISSYEVDANSKVSLQSLCNFMQESAWHHAETIGLGYKKLMEGDQLWLLTRLLIKIDKFPGWGETVIVETWAKDTDRIFAYRDFNILDETNKIIVAASGAWVVIDKRSKRPQRMIPFRESMSLLPEKNAIKGKLYKISPLSGYKKKPFFTVQFGNLDMNKHVNNCKYIGWILDSYPREIRENYEISTFEINFLSEAFYGDELSIRSERIKEHKLEFLNNILRKNDSREICRARTQWRRVI